MRSEVEIKNRLDFLKNEYKKNNPKHVQEEIRHKINELIFVLGD